jgi:hypothetical protein
MTGSKRETKMEQAGQRPSAALMRLVNGYQVSQAIHVAATLGIADLLADGPRTSDDLAAATDCAPPSFYRLLRALASVGVFREEGGRRFAMTPLGDCLRADRPEGVGFRARRLGLPFHWQPWGDLLRSVRTGENAFRHLHGMDLWEYQTRHPEAGAIFDADMTSNTRRQVAALLAAYDFGRFTRLVDVGGGQGALLAAILAEHPAAHGVLFDRPQVVAQAEPLLQAADVGDRCQVVGGSFFESVPPGGDAYLLKVILHDWADEPAIAILQTCRRAIGPTGTLLVIEHVVGPPNEDDAGKRMDLHMLVMLGGRERTREEWTALLASGGFHLAGITPTASELSVIEGSPA